MGRQKRRKVSQMRAEFKSEHDYRAATCIQQCCKVCVHSDRPGRLFGAYHCDKMWDGVVAWHATCNLHELAEGPRVKKFIKEHEQWRTARDKRKEKREMKERFYVSREDALAAIKELTKTHARVCRCMGCVALKNEQEWQKYELGESKRKRKVTAR